MGFTREAESPCPRVEGPTPQLATKRSLVPGTYVWRPAPQEELLLCVNVAGPGWASPEKRSRPAHGWKGRPRSWQRSARWYQFFFFIPGTRRSLVPYTKTKTIFHFSTLKPTMRSMVPCIASLHLAETLTPTALPHDSALQL